MDREDLRLQILFLLKAAQGYEANQEVLLKSLKQKGILLTRSQLQIELAWLETQANAIIANDLQGVWIATLTTEGLEIADGLAVVPFIRRPTPFELS